MQAHHIVEALEETMGDGESHPIIFLGDFNSTPNSAVYRLLKHS